MLLNLKLNLEPNGMKLQLVHGIWASAHKRPSASRQQTARRSERGGWVGAGSLVGCVGEAGGDQQQSAPAQADRTGRAQVAGLHASCALAMAIDLLKTVNGSHLCMQLLARAFHCSEAPRAAWAGTRRRLMSPAGPLLTRVLYPRATRWLSEKSPSSLSRQGSILWRHQLARKTSATSAPHQSSKKRA